MFEVVSDAYLKIFFNAPVNHYAASMCLLFLITTILIESFESGILFLYQIRYKKIIECDYIHFYTHKRFDHLKNFYQFFHSNCICFKRDTIRHILETSSAVFSSMNLQRLLARCVQKLSVVAPLCYCIQLKFNYAKKLGPFVFALLRKQFLTFKYQKATSKE